MHQPHAGEAVEVAQPDTADGGGAAQDDGRERARVEAVAEAPAGHEVVLGVVRPPQPDPTGAEHHGEVHRDDEVVEHVEPF